MTDRVDINRLLIEMRSLKAQTQAFNKPMGLAAKDVVDNQLQPNEIKPAGFGELLTRAIDNVNASQHASAAASKAYTRGEPSVDITDVMIASQKAGVSFQAMVQVRNKLIEAYRDIMNMPL